VIKRYILTVSKFSKESSLVSYLFLILYAYTNEPIAREVEAKMPDRSIKAKRPPTKPPFNLSRFDLIRSIKRKKVVAFKEAIFKIGKVANGFNNILLDFYNTLKTKNKNRLN